MAEEIDMIKIDVDKIVAPSVKYTHFYVLFGRQSRKNLGFAYSYFKDDMYPIFFQESPLPGEKESLVAIAISSEQADEKIINFLSKKIPK